MKTTLTIISILFALSLTENIITVSENKTLKADLNESIALTNRSIAQTKEADRRAESYRTMLLDYDKSTEELRNEVRKTIKILSTIK